MGARSAELRDKAGLVRAERERKVRSAGAIGKDRAEELGVLHVKGVRTGKASAYRG